MPQSGDVLERFIETLVQEIMVNRPAYLTSPFTVAEIYQGLVPYRSHRALIGVEMNADYEEALLQMLSGEGVFLCACIPALNTFISRHIHTSHSLCNDSNAIAFSNITLFAGRYLAPRQNRGYFLTS